MDQQAKIEVSGNRKAVQIDFTTRTGRQVADMNERVGRMVANRRQNVVVERSRNAQVNLESIAEVRVVEFDARDLKRQCFGQANRFAK